VQEWVALLGTRNAPTDGVEDYCAFLAEALARRNVALAPVRVEWRREGWKTALQSLALRAEEWRDKWVFLQYTALAWSRRGLPFGALKVLQVLGDKGARIGVLFHEPWHQEAPFSLVQPLRAASQDYVIRQLHKRADLSIFTLPANKISWLQENDPKAAFIPIGANIPELTGEAPALPRRGEKTVAVFCFSPGHHRHLEIGDMVYAARTAQRNGESVHLMILGRGSQEIESEVREALAGSGVRVSATGIQPAREIAKKLSDCDALLFVSGNIAQTRGSALAAVACGIPIVGYGGAVEGTPLAEAGVVLSPYRERQAFADALARVLSDHSLNSELRRRSTEAHRKHFSWDVIAEKFVASCGPTNSSKNIPGDSGRQSLRSAEVLEETAREVPLGSASLKHR
jgi:glycosyltransferase involved in cell wall biosynthesis